MIDYFSYEELMHFQYLIMSAKIPFGGRIPNGAKAHALWPPPEIAIELADNPNPKIFEKEYHAFLDSSETGGSTNVTWGGGFIYKTFINPYLNHVDILIICDEKEQYITDALCSYLKKNYKLETIDLNQLFKTGHVGEIYIDRNLTRDKAVDIRRAAGNDMIRALEGTREGRLKVLSMMSKKDKLKKLKELGITVTDKDKDRLDALLIDAWVDDNGEGDYDNA